MTETNIQFEKVLAVCRELFEKKLYDYGASWRIMRPCSLTDQIYLSLSSFCSASEKTFIFCDLTSCSS